MFIPWKFRKFFCLCHCPSSEDVYWFTVMPYGYRPATATLRERTHQFKPPLHYAEIIISGDLVEDFP